MGETYSLKPKDLNKQWILIDASNLVVGRLAALITRHLRGKDKAGFTPHMDCGDHIVVVNCDKLRLTGDKLNKKIYYRHTGYPGGIKAQTAGEIVRKQQTERLLQKAVKGMMPKGPLARAQMRNLRLYQGPQHPHEAQNPTRIDVAALNRKNVVHDDHI